MDELVLWVLLELKEMVIVASDSVLLLKGGMTGTDWLGNLGRGILAMNVSADNVVGVGGLYCIRVLLTVVAGTTVVVDGWEGGLREAVG